MHSVTVPPEPVVSASGALRVHVVPAASDNLVFVIEARDGQAVVVDGPDAGGALALCESRGLRLTSVWNTHTHGDHVGVNRDLAKRGLLDGMRVVGSAKAAAQVPGITHPVDEGASVDLGGLTAAVMLTEGHIDGHVSFLVDGLLFCGDTLFGAGCGYLFDGPPSKMHESLGRLAALAEDTRVLCAHEYTQDNLRFAFSVEPDNAALIERIRRTWALRSRGECSVPSTIGEERRTNPFLRHGSATLRARVAEAMPGVALDTPERVFAATRALKDRKDYKRIADADLPL